jgi:hypothetical protein
MESVVCSVCKLDGTVLCYAVLGVALCWVLCGKGSTILCRIVYSVFQYSMVLYSSVHYRAVILTVHNITVPFTHLFFALLFPLILQVRKNGTCPWVRPDGKTQVRTGTNILYKQSVLFSKNCFCSHSLSSSRPSPSLSFTLPSFFLFLLLLNSTPSHPILLPRFSHPLPPPLLSTHTYSLTLSLSTPPPRSHVSTGWMGAVPSQLECTPSSSPHSTLKARTLYFVHIMQYLHIVDMIFAFFLQTISVFVSFLFSFFIRTS